jgi:hypothetical protein
MMKRTARYALICAIVVLFAMAPASLYFWNEVPHTPTKPDLKNGFVFPYNSHGVTHYVTWFDHLLSNAFGIALLVVIPILIIAVIAANFQRKPGS